MFTGTTYRYNYDLSGRTLGINANNGTAVKFVYDNFNRVSKQISAVQNETLTTEYLYGTAEDGRLNGVLYGIKQNGQNSISNTYDELARVNKRTVDAANSYETEYTYLEGGDPNTTTTVIKTVKNGGNIYEYSYDDVGNITEIKKNGITVQKYSYDSLNQLVTATYGGHTYTYAYDNAGNILSVKKDGTEVKTYGYGDSEWKDLLTEFNGDTITYDQIGNPLSYRNGFNFTWSNGRQLTSVTRGETNVSYLYNADGMRTQKTINGITTDYYYLNGVLQAQKTGDEYIIFLYDENGSAYGMIIKNGETVANYYYLFNAQGDVIGIIDQNGEQVVTYEYGAWGDVVSVTGSLAQTVGAKNPIRYRGYYYDGETGFYYLQSRYYDPYTARFINADGQLNNDILGNNLFIYCGNTPTIRVDDNGQGWWVIAGAAVGLVTGALTKIVSNVATGKKWYKGVAGAAIGGAVSGGVFALTGNAWAASFAGAAAESAFNQAMSYVPKGKKSKQKRKKLTAKNVRNSLGTVFRDTVVNGTVSAVTGKVAGKMVPTNSGWIQPEKFVSSFTGKYAVKSELQALAQSGLSAGLDGIKYSFAQRTEHHQEPIVNLFSDLKIQEAR